jgi:catechol 2,3-dioxygenase-like lactoylglutathione lyase family enzyme
MAHPLPSGKDMTRILAIQPRLPVAELGASCRFYRDLLGFAGEGGESGDSAGFAILERDDVGLQLVTASADHPAGRMTIWLGVQDARSEHERLKGRTAIEWGPEVYWYGCCEFAILDPDGHRIIFSSRSDEPPTCTGEE